MNLVEAANLRHLNLRHSAAQGGVQFEGLLRGDQFKVLRSCSKLFQGDWLEAEHLTALKRAVSSIYWYVRLPLFFSSSPNDHLDRLGEELNRQADLTASFLDQIQISQVRSLAKSLDLLRDWDPGLGELGQTLDGFGQRLLLVTEESKWSGELDRLIDTLGKQDHWTVVPALGYLARELPRSFDALVLLGDPNRLSQGHSRLLFCSGLAPKLICLVPGPMSFSSRSISEKVFGILEPRIKFPNFSPTAFADKPLEVEENFEAIEIKMLTRPSLGEVDLEALGSSGSQRCKLLRIADEEVIPIETDAVRVSTLLFDRTDGKVKEVQVEGNELRAGLVVFALVSQGEQEFLWTAARVDMGPRYSEFDVVRKSWINKLRSFVQEHGPQEAERILRARGVTTANNLDDWISSENFLRPRADIDFRALLQALDLDEFESERVMRLTSEFSGGLIKVAKTARKLVCDALSEEHWGFLMNDENLNVSLEELGDATYRLGKILSVSDDEFMLPASQVRRVVRG
jgi:hypothetical protein